MSVAVAGAKVLIVEDNAVNRRLAEFLLGASGYQVQGAATAQEAFDRVEADRPDLILMDLQLPGMDGFEATRRLKANSATRDIPVLAVTAYAMRDDREMARAAGCAGFITKPIDKTAFLAEVATHLGGTSNEYELTG
jgi:two-component system cell cycle response regulator DivK